MPNNLQMSSRGAAYLVCDLASKMLNGEFREGYFRLQVQWVVAVVIVTLLEKGVVCRLKSPWQTLIQLFECGKCHLGHEPLLHTSYSRISI